MSRGSVTKRCALASAGGPAKWLSTSVTPQSEKQTAQRMQGGGERRFPSLALEHPPAQKRECREQERASSRDAAAPKRGGEWDLCLGRRQKNGSLVKHGSRIDCLVLEAKGGVVDCALQVGNE